MSGSPASVECAASRAWLTLRPYRSWPAYDRLKLLLQSGKSEIWFPGIASGQRGPVVERGIHDLVAAEPALLIGDGDVHDLAAPPLLHRHDQLVGLQRPARHPRRAGRQRAQLLEDETRATAGSRATAPAPAPARRRPRPSPPGCGRTGRCRTGGRAARRGARRTPGRRFPRSRARGTSPAERRRPPPVGRAPRGSRAGCVRPARAPPGARSSRPRASDTMAGGMSNRTPPGRSRPRPYRLPEIVMRRLRHSPRIRPK